MRMSRNVYVGTLTSISGHWLPHCETKASLQFYLLGYRAHSIPGHSISFKGNLFVATRLKLPECSLHFTKRKETREVKTFSTKTSRDVGMVPSVSKEHVCLHEKSTGGKTSGTRRGTIPCSTTQVGILRHQAKTLWIRMYRMSINIM